MQCWEGGDVRAEAGEVEETLWCASVIAFEVVETMNGVAGGVASAFSANIGGSDFDCFPRGHAGEQKSLEHLGKRVEEARQLQW